MHFQSNFQLKEYNTFGIAALAKEFIGVSNSTELASVLKTTQDVFVLGGGSNMLLTQNIEKLVIHVNLKGIEIVNEDENFVWVRAQAGENWHEFVIWCIEHDFGGIENLSLIPGNVGTTPIQNIGAYGIEIKDTFDSCTAMKIDNQSIKSFDKATCSFGYRESIFKNELKNQYIITDVTYKLTKKNHKINTSYGAIDIELEKDNITNPTIKEISKAVISIRQSKLPNPKELGNSGSFFKNPIISKVYYNKIKQNHPEIPHYVVSETEVKVPAGWLIEKTGFKGKRFGDAGIHKNQALVLVNYGNATGQEILAVSKDIQDTIFKKFGIHIEAEVNVI
jgi:UDP-N-acetylmuramate dehydrogenase